VLLKSSLTLSILAVALLFPSIFENTVQARICMTPDSPLGNLAKNFLNIPMIKQGIQKKMAENPGNKTFLKVVDEASKNMTSMLCKPGEVATIFNATAPPYYPASNKTVNSINPELNSTLADNTTTVVQPQIKKNNSISFKTTLESISPPAGEFLTPPPITQLDIPQKSNFTFGPGSPLCPTNDCKQEVIGGFYDISRPLSPVIQGTLKIENKTTSTPDTIKYSMIAFVGNFQITGTEENRKTGHSVTILSGDLGLGGGTLSGIIHLEFTYNVNGTFDNTTKLLSFEGERSTS
jgi:hypothetical protein